VDSELLTQQRLSLVHCPGFHHLKLLKDGQEKTVAAVSMSLLSLAIGPVYNDIEIAKNAVINAFAD